MKYREDITYGVQYKNHSDAWRTCLWDKDFDVIRRFYESIKDNHKIDYRVIKMVITEETVPIYV